MPLVQARRLYQALNMDLATVGVGSGDAVAATPCHIGQPVALADGAGGTAGALRISADARLVSESWAGAGETGAMMRLSERIAGISTVFAKLRFLLSRPDRLDVADVS
jgi:uncharacterized low-complexity protein